MDWSLAKPLWLGAACLPAGGGTWPAIGRWAPTCCRGWTKADSCWIHHAAGSSLSENKPGARTRGAHLRTAPEVESTSRRTGLQWAWLR